MDQYTSLIYLHLDGEATPSQETQLASLLRECGISRSELSVR